MRGLIVLLVLMACSYEPVGEDAIDAVNFYLSTKECGKALDILNSYQGTSVEYFQVRASAIACMANYSEIDILEHEIPKINDNSGNHSIQDLSPFTNITGAIGSTGVTDTSYVILQEAFDVLTYMGVDPKFVDPSTIDYASTEILEDLAVDINKIDIETMYDLYQDPGAVSVNFDDMKFPTPNTDSRQSKMNVVADSDDTNLQALGILIMNFSKYLAFYGNVGEDVLGKKAKGLGPLTNKCFGNYSNNTFTALEAFASANYGPCLRGESGHSDIPTITDVDSAKVMCHGITMLNQIIDLNAGWSDEYWYKLDMSKISARLEDTKVQLQAAGMSNLIDEMTGLLNLNNCLKFAITDPDVLELYFALMFEMLLL